MTNKPDKENEHMKAFVDTPITKEQFIKNLKWHQEQDAFISGIYSKIDGDKFQGCAVGCSIHSIQMELNGKGKYDYEDHGLYETYLNVPMWVAYLEDKIFEGLPEDRQKTWPVEFGEAINVGAELDKIKLPFLAIVVQSAYDSFDHEKYPKQAKVVKDILDELNKGRIPGRELTADAYDAYADAYDADVYDAAAAAAADATYAAYAAAYAVYAAAHAAAAYADAAAYARKEKCIYFADELLELMRGCK